MEPLYRSQSVAACRLCGATESPAWCSKGAEDVARSIFEGVPGGEPYALVTSCSDVVDFLKSSEIDSAIGFVHDSYRGRARV
jgi:hypothetical protein